MSVAAAPRPRATLIEWVGSTDHKRVAVRVGTYAFAFFLLSGLFALFMRTELAQPGLQLLSENTYNELFTMHGSGMFFLVMTPLALALGVYFVPLQIGASEIAFPRLALAGDWLIPLGGATMFAGFATDHGAAKFGWTAFAPLSDHSYSPGYGVDLWLVGVVLATGGSFLLGICVLWSVLRLRAPGMTMLRLPVFTWTMVATCLLVVAAFPALFAAMALLFADRHFSGVFESAGGPVAYQHLFWFYGHPVVYVIFFPFVGAVAEVVAVFSRRRFFGYSALVLSLLVFAGLSMAVWAHHMFTTGQVTNKYFSLTSTLLIVPAGVEYFDLIGTMIGGLTGIIVASPPLDYHVHDSFFVVGHFHYTIFAGSLFGFFAGVYYWWPKVTGRLLREGLGKLHFALYFVGANLTFFPMLISGYEGMPRRVADYADIADLSLMNLLSTIGAFTIALGTLVFLWNVWVSARNPVLAGNDPWEGHTLEWWTASPPPRHNFDSLPPVRSYAPLYDRRVGEA